MTAVTVLHVQNQILVEQDVAVVIPIGKVIDCKDARRPLALHALPPRIKCIVVDDEPVDRPDAIDRLQCLLGVLLPGRRQPERMGGSVRRRSVRTAVRIRQQPHGMPLAFDQACQASRMAAQQEEYVCTVVGQIAGQAEAPHEMPHAHFGGSIDADYDPLHRVHQTGLGYFGCLPTEKVDPSQWPCYPPTDEPAANVRSRSRRSAT